MLGATGGLIAVGLLKTRADALSVEEEAADLQTAAADPTKVLGAPTSVPSMGPRSSIGCACGRVAATSCVA